MLLQAHLALGEASALQEHLATRQAGVRQQALQGPLRAALQRWPLEKKLGLCAVPLGSPVRDCCST
eukprot:5306331-Pyramimonas_sp.AAC.1